MEPKERFEIQLSHVCNNRCVFCVSGQMTELRMAKPTPLDELKTRFDEAAARGITKVTILGGEPTIHATFFPILAHALALGFETIEIFTNGARLDKPDFIERVMALGRDRFTWRISIQGWDRETHDLTTKKPGAFDRIVAGIEALAALGQTITCNMCVVEQNYRSLVELPAFVTRYPIQQVHLDMVRPRDAGTRDDDELDAMLPDYASLGAVMREMFERLDRVAPDFDLNVGNLPYCQLPEWAHRIHHGGAKTYTVSADGPGKLSVVAWDKYEDKRSDKRKLDSCGACAFERRCDGFVELYAERRGTEQFLPVSREKLRRMDPRQRAFIHQIDGALVGLVRERVAGWRLLAADDDERERWATQTWTHEAGGRALLRFLPAGSEGGGDGEHRDFVVRVESWRGVDEPAVLELLVGVFDRVVAALGGEVRHAPERARFERRRALVAEGAVPTNVHAALGKLLQRGTIAGNWRIDGAWPNEDASGVRIAFVGPRGVAATLFLHAPAPGRIAGKWDFLATDRGKNRRGHDQAQRSLAVAVADLLRPGEREAAGA
ncbi:radical SAM protein [Nannocystaceae bacterium ST9]